MRTFTPKEKGLFQEIAKIEKKRLSSGDLVLYKNEVWIVTLLAIEYIEISQPMQLERIHIDRAIPIWQEHDCLEWLKEKGWTNYCCYPVLKNGRELSIAHEPFDFKGEDHLVMQGNTDLENFLSAILAIMKEK